MDETNIELYFKNLQLTDWEFYAQMKQSGNQSGTIIVRNKNTEELGVFRLAKRKNEESIPRFKRDLEILKNTNHPNIVKILAWTNDPDNNPWYITKKG